MASTTYVVRPGTFVIADIRDGAPNRVMTGPDEDGDYRDVLSEDYYPASTVINVRPAAVLSVPTITGTQQLGPVKMYNTSTGTAFKPNGSEDIDQKIETASAAIAVKFFEVDSDPKNRVKRDLERLLAGEGNIIRARQLIGQARELGILDL